MQNWGVFCEQRASPLETNMNGELAGFISIGVGLVAYGFAFAYGYGKLSARVNGQDDAVKEAKKAADDRFIALYNTVIDHLKTTGADNTRIEKSLSRIETKLDGLPCESRGEKIDQIQQDISHVRGRMERQENGRPS